METAYTAEIAVFVRLFRPYNTCWPGNKMIVRSQWVINYKADEDIQVLAGDLDLSVLKPRFPHCYERYLSSIFFNRKSQKLAECGDETLAIWHFRAALSEFQGILDLVNSDIPSSCGQMWKKSDIRKNLYSHELVYTMTRIRNMIVHTKKLEYGTEERSVTFVPGGTRDVLHLVLEPITPNHFERNDQLSPDTIIWFNRQASTWSANALLTQSSFVLMVALDNFVRMNVEYIGQQEDALDKIKRAERALSCE